jgi:hypothetical protein
LISKLVVKKIINRMGCSADSTDHDILAHPFFIVTDDDSLKGRLMSAPWIPVVKSGVDASNFDSYAVQEGQERGVQGSKERSAWAVLTAAEQSRFTDF